MNTSFSAMNSSLSQKWMNKKNQIGGTTQLPPNAQGSMQQQMSNTVAAGFQSNNQANIPTYSNQQMNQSLGAVEANFDLGSGGSLPPQ